MTQEDAVDRLRKSKSRLEAEYGVQKIGIFGSMARGEATLSSDVDVFVSLKDAELFALGRLRDELAAIFESDVDLVHEHRRLSKSFLERITLDLIYV